MLKCVAFPASPWTQKALPPVRDWVASVCLATQLESAGTITGLFGNCRQLMDFLPPQNFIKLEACWDVCCQTVFFLRWLCHPFSHCGGCECSLINPSAWITEPGVPTSSRLHVVYRHAVSQTPQAGAHACTHKYGGWANIHKYNMFIEHQIGCEGVYLLWSWMCVGESVHVSHAFPGACVCWLTSFGVCVSDLHGEREFVQYICMSLRTSLWCLPLSGAAISLLSWCENFHFYILLSFPDGTEFSLSILLVMTYLDYLSMGSHINPKKQRNKEPKAQLKRKTELSDV